VAMGDHVKFSISEGHRSRRILALLHLDSVHFEGSVGEDGLNSELQSERYNLRGQCGEVS